MEERSIAGWVAEETKYSGFCDKRLKKRFQKLLLDLSKNIGSGVTVACQDWANTKAAYRFFSNSRVSEQDILGGHFQSTKKRFGATAGPVLVLHDTTEFSFKREDPQALGLLKQLPVQKVFGDPVYTCGILMHSSLVVTPEGLPLGIAAIKFWTRKRFKGADALKRNINPTRVPIKKKESYRWLENLRQSTALLGDPARCIHIGDRESDIYELFCLSEEQNTKFLFRTCVDRVAGNGDTLISEMLLRQPVKGTYKIEITNKAGERRQANLDIKFAALKVHPPEYKKRAYPELNLTVIEARERGKVKNSERIHWKLITNLRVSSVKSAVEKLTWYAMRWNIETFHKICKSGCRAEDSKLRTAERLTNLLAIYCILSWRIFWLTILKRHAPICKASCAFTKQEIAILKSLERKSVGANNTKCSLLESCILQVARLGGYLNRSSDPPPGNLVIWRGMARLADIQIGTLL